MDLSLRTAQKSDSSINAKKRGSMALCAILSRLIYGAEVVGAVKKDILQKAAAQQIQREVIF